MRNNFSILVNTCDAFEDCWEPFFKLFSKFWPDYRQKIYLNTETKDYHYNDLEIISTKIATFYDKSNLTWSECLLKAFDIIDTDIFLLFFEDNFLVDFVKQDLIEKLVDIMLSEDITYIGLGGNQPPFHETAYELLVMVDQKANYRINTSPSLWNIKKMRKYIRKHENPWQFEIYGTRRAHLIKDKIYSINPKFCNPEKAILPFIEGMRKGKWVEEEVVDLFRRNSIEIDLSKRGFYDRSRKKRCLKNYLSFNLFYSKFLSEIELLRMRRFSQNKIIL